MKSIVNPQRKNEIENKLTELLNKGTETKGFYFSIGEQEFVYEGTWEGFGQLMKEGLPFKTLKLHGDLFNDPLLNRQFSKFVYSADSANQIPLTQRDVTPRMIYSEEVAKEIVKLQKEYQGLITESGVVGS